VLELAGEIQEFIPRDQPDCHRSVYAQTADVRTKLASCFCCFYIRASPTSRPNEYCAGLWKAGYKHDRGRRGPSPTASPLPFIFGEPRLLVSGRLADTFLTRTSSVRA
jgi:hypothetical protein